MSTIWLDWVDKLDLHGGGHTELTTVTDRKAGRTIDTEEVARKFLSQIQPRLSKTHPDYVWSIEEFFETRPFPYFAIRGERRR